MGLAVVGFDVGEKGVGLPVSVMVGLKVVGLIDRLEVGPGVVGASVRLEVGLEVIGALDGAMLGPPVGDSLGFLGVLLEGLVVTGFKVGPIVGLSETGFGVSP